jgi:hypothetical protein
MTDLTKPPRDLATHILDQDWGPAFVREFDLVIAANVHHEMKTREILTDVILAQRVASICRPFDLELREKFLGIVDVPLVVGETNHQTLKRLLQDLAQHPRGHWVIFRKNDKFDAWMSDGIGGTATASGEKFAFRDADSPHINFLSAYAAVFSAMIYHRRNAIYEEIAALSFERANITHGSTLKNVELMGKTWSKATLVAVLPNYYVGGTSAYKFRLTRRGAKAKEIILERRDVFRIFEIEPILPAQYDDPGYQARHQSLHERRTDAAQFLWDRLTNPENTIIEQMKVLREFDRADHVQFDRLGSKAPFKSEQDTFSRAAYRDPDPSKSPAFTYRVQFAPGNSDIINASITANGCNNPFRAAA